jgi:SAM-dependent methyltransferase
MKLRTILALLASGRLSLLWRLSRDIVPVYRVAFLSAASPGVLEHLAAGPLSVEVLAQRAGLPPAAHEALAAWLQVGVSVGALRPTSAGFALRGKVAKALAQGNQDAFVAMLQQTLSLHRRMITETPRRLREGKRFTLADQDGTLIARVSKLVEPFVNDALDAVVPASGSFKLLDVGCGEGRYLRHACLRNPALAGVGVELQEDVAQMCRDNLDQWGLAPRVRVEVGDIRGMAPRADYDLVTMHSLIYYFPWEQRVELLRHVRGFLKPRGRLLVTTSCQGDHPTLAVLNLWATMTEGCGRLPTALEMHAQLRSAGFATVTQRALIPGEHVLAFVAAD